MQKCKASITCRPLHFDHVGDDLDYFNIQNWSKVSVEDSEGQLLRSHRLPWEVSYHKWATNWSWKVKQLRKWGDQAATKQHYQEELCFEATRLVSCDSTPVGKTWVTVKGGRLLVKTPLQHSARKRSATKETIQKLVWPRRIHLLQFMMTKWISQCPGLILSWRITTSLLQKLFEGLSL